MRVEAVLFDYGLVLTGPPCPVAWARMGAVTGLEPAALERAYWRRRADYDRGVLSGREYWSQVGAGEGRVFTEEQVCALVAADTALWTRPNEPVIGWAARLAQAGTRTGILSNLGDEMMHGVLRELPWLAGFGTKVWSHTLRLTKPDRAIYVHAAGELGVPVETILFVDDRAENVEGALAAGMQAVRYGEHGAFMRELERRGLGELWRVGRDD